MEALQEIQLPARPVARQRPRLMPDGTVLAGWPALPETVGPLPRTAAPFRSEADARRALKLITTAMARECYVGPPPAYRIDGHLDSALAIADLAAQVALGEGAATGIDIRDGQQRSGRVEPMVVVTDSDTPVRAPIGSILVALGDVEVEGPTEVIRLNPRWKPDFGFAARVLVDSDLIYVDLLARVAAFFSAHPVAGRPWADVVPPLVDFMFSASAAVPAVSRSVDARIS